MNSNLVTVSGVLLGVAVGILLFRLARELYMGEQGERTWLAFAERLVVAYDRVGRRLPLVGASREC